MALVQDVATQVLTCAMAVSLPQKQSDQDEPEQDPALHEDMQSDQAQEGSQAWTEGRRRRGARRRDFILFVNVLVLYRSLKSERLQLGYAEGMWMREAKIKLAEAGDTSEYKASPRV